MVMLAKGNRSQQVRDACAQYGGFYLGSIGGPAARLAGIGLLYLSHKNRGLAGYGMGTDGQGDLIEIISQTAMPVFVSARQRCS